MTYQDERREVEKRWESEDRIEWNADYASDEIPLISSELIDVFKKAQNKNPI